MRPRCSSARRRSTSRCRIPGAHERCAALGLSTFMNRAHRGRHDPPARPGADGAAAVVMWAYGIGAVEGSSWATVGVLGWLPRHGFPVNRELSRLDPNEEAVVAQWPMSGATGGAPSISTIDGVVARSPTLSCSAASGRSGFRDPALGGGWEVPADDGEDAADRGAWNVGSSATCIVRRARTVRVGGYVRMATRHEGTRPQGPAPGRRGIGPARRPT